MMCRPGLQPEPGLNDASILYKPPNDPSARAWQCHVSGPTWQKSNLNRTGRGRGVAAGLVVPGIRVQLDIRDHESDSEVPVILIVLNLTT
jgi:hypothetical protein